MRNFIKYYLFKVLFVLLILESGFLLWSQYKNKKPEIIADLYSVFSRQKLKMEPLKNDKDKENDSIYIESFNQPLHGKVFQKEGLLFYQPDSNFQGTDSLIYLISDGKNKSEPGYIRIEVKENKGPLTVNDTIVIFNGRVNELNVMFNDTDMEKDSIYFENFSVPLYGKVENIKNRMYYTPKEHFTGRDSFNYVLTDGNKKSGIAKVHLIVKNGEFGSDPYFGNALHYTFHNTLRYDILRDNNNNVLAIWNDYYLPWANGAIQEYCTINDRDFNNFILRFKAKPFRLRQWVEYSVIFSYKDCKNYCCIHFFYRDNTGRVQAFSIKDGIPQDIFCNDVKLFSDTKFHDVEVQKNADSISVKFDRKYVGGASDSRFLLDKGAVGFGTKTNMIYFDDVYVTGK